MRIFAVVAVLFLVGATVSPSLTAESSTPWKTDGLDHIMLWTRDIDRTTAIFAVKLGFQVRPGDDFGDGVANRIIRIADGGYLELLYATRPESELDEGTREELRGVGGGPGSRTFALRVRALDALDTYLRSKGFAMAPSAPAMFDPDGPGPRMPQPSDYRVVAFQKPPISTGDLFFIDYKPEPQTPASIADRRIAREHPNGSLAFSAVWLLSADAAGDRDKLLQIGFGAGSPVNLPTVHARGFRLTAGTDSVLVIQPDGAGIAEDALKKRGPHLFAVSIGTPDLDRAQRRVERGYGQDMGRYVGPMGDSFLAPTLDDLGVVIEFHAEPATHRGG